MIFYLIVLFLITLLFVIIIIHHSHMQHMDHNQETHRRWLIDITSQMQNDERTNNEIFKALLHNQIDFKTIMEEHGTGEVR